MFIYTITSDIITNSITNCNNRWKGEERDAMEKE